MKKSTKDKISKFLFKSLTKKMSSQLRKVFERDDIKFEPPYMKATKRGKFNFLEYVKIKINLETGSYE